MIKSRDDILLSVIVPVFNSQPYIRTLIDSVLGQSWKYMELILVDDGSTDGSAEICEYYSGKDTRVVVIHQKNKGQANARNIGLELAKGNLVSFADNDDILNPYMYETLIKNMLITKSDVSACGFMHATNEQISEIEFSLPNKTYTVLSREQLIRDYLKPSWKIPVWNKIYKKEIVKNLRFDNQRLGEDNLFSYNVIKKLEKLVFIDEPLYVQRMHGGNYEIIGYKQYNELLHVKKIVLDCIKNDYYQEYKEAYKSFIYECIRTYNFFLDQNNGLINHESVDAFSTLRDSISIALLFVFPKGHLHILMKIKLGVIRVGERIQI